MHARADRLLFAAAIVLAAVPLWVSQRLPVVDLPQHLHVLAVLRGLGDATTLYPEVFSARGTLTPYLGYYQLVSWLGWLLPLELANRVFLTAYVAGMALSLGYLLDTLRRPTWPALLALPFAYGDNFGWGFINYVSAIPLTFLCLGLFIRTLSIRPKAHRLALPLALSGCLVGVLLFHVQAFVYLGLALPFLLVFTPATAAGENVKGSLRRWLSPRWPALLAVQPALILFCLWGFGRLGEPADIEVGAPWKAWGPLLSAENLAFKAFGQNLRELPDVLANLLRDGSDRLALYAVFAIASAAWVAGLLEARTTQAAPTPLGRSSRALVLPCLGALALALYFLLPFDVRGYIYYVNTRYAQLALPLLVASVPVLSPKLGRGFLFASVGASLLVAVSLSRGFLLFDEEARPLETMVEATADKPRVMALIFDSRSAVVRHPVYLHAGAHLARLRGGLTNFSFALTPHSPLRYTGQPPPTYPSEWRPWDFDFERHGRSYDHFLLRAVAPERLETLFGPFQADARLFIAAQAGEWTLVRKQ